jgi:hypothetical protein
LRNLAHRRHRDACKIQPNILVPVREHRSQPLASWGLTCGMTSSSLPARQVTHISCVWQQLQRW